MSTDEPVIEVRGLAKRFRSLWLGSRVEALAGIDLVVRRGEVFGLLGPNGSGKTTALRILLGLTRPSAGSVRIFGRRPGDLEVYRRLGYLPEENAFPRFLTGRQLLRLGGALHGLKPRELEPRVEQMLALVGMQGRAGRRLGICSKGMARRLGLAQALIASPELLILDEPTVGLDPLANAEFRALIRDQACAGVTVLVSSHILSDMEQLCDRVAILNQGRIVRTGALTELLQGPQGPRRLEEAFLEAVRTAGAAGIKS